LISKPNVSNHRTLCYRKRCRKPDNGYCAAARGISIPSAATISAAFSVTAAASSCAFAGSSFAAASA
jgi:hypothetical protein